MIRLIRQLWARLFGTHYDAPAFMVPVLQRAMRSASHALKMRNTVFYIAATVVPGDARQGDFWGIRKGDTIVGGTTERLSAGRYRMTIYVDAHLRAAPGVVEHECAHALLFEAGVPVEQHHDRSRAAGMRC